MPSRGALGTLLEFQNHLTTGGGPQRPPMAVPAPAMAMVTSTVAAGSQEDFLAVTQLLKDLILDQMSGSVPKHLISINNLPQL